MKKYIVTIIILFIIILLSIGGYFAYANTKVNESNKDDMLKAKCISEIEYLSKDIVYMMNKLNNISYSNYKIENKEIDIKSQTNSTANENVVKSSTIISDNILNNDKDDINWNLLKSKIENMYSTWPTVMMDLTTLNVKKENLIKYNNILDKITNNFEDKNKSESLINLANLYNLLELYIKDIEADSQKVSLFIVQTNILYGYAFIEKDNWNKGLEYIANAKEEFSNILNNQLNNVNDIDVINKSYILINELEKNSNNKDKNIFYINYSNLMQELENI